MQVPLPPPLPVLSQHPQHPSHPLQLRNQHPRVKQRPRHSVERRRRAPARVLPDQVHRALPPPPPHPPPEVKPQPAASSAASQASASSFAQASSASLAASSSFSSAFSSAHSLQLSARCPFQLGFNVANTLGIGNAQASVMPLSQAVSSSALEPVPANALSAPQHPSHPLPLHNQHPRVKQAASGFIERRRRAPARVLPHPVLRALPPPPPHPPPENQAASQSASSAASQASASSFAQASSASLAASSSFSSAFSSANSLSALGNVAYQLGFNVANISVSATLQASVMPYLKLSLQSALEPVPARTLMPFPMQLDNSLAGQGILNAANAGSPCLLLFPVLSQQSVASSAAAQTASQSQAAASAFSRAAPAERQRVLPHPVLRAFSTTTTTSSSGSQAASRPQNSAASQASAPSFAQHPCFPCSLKFFLQRLLFANSLSALGNVAYQLGFNVAKHFGIGNAPASVMPYFQASLQVGVGASSRTYANAVSNAVGQFLAGQAAQSAPRVKQLPPGIQSSGVAEAPPECCPIGAQSFPPPPPKSASGSQAASQSASSAASQASASSNLHKLSPASLAASSFFSSAFSSANSLSALGTLLSIRLHELTLSVSATLQARFPCLLLCQCSISSAASVASCTANQHPRVKQLPRHSVERRRRAPARGCPIRCSRALPPPPPHPPPEVKPQASPQAALPRKQVPLLRTQTSSASLAASSSFSVPSLRPIPSQTLGNVAYQLGFNVANTLGIGNAPGLGNALSQAVSSVGVGASSSTYANAVSNAVWTILNRSGCTITSQSQAAASAFSLSGVAERQPECCPIGAQSSSTTTTTSASGIKPQASPPSSAASQASGPLHSHKQTSASLAASSSFSSAFSSANSFTLGNPCLSNLASTFPCLLLCQCPSPASVASSAAAQSASQSQAAASAFSRAASQSASQSAARSGARALPPPPPHPPPGSQAAASPQAALPRKQVPLHSHKHPLLPLQPQVLSPAPSLRPKFPPQLSATLLIN
ncbi:hypothetical protein HNY73_023251 [Argiope bruennichi]|uniref:Tubuliform egg casing silk strands structural domain-containing protein n=1 Tax=Argiope bruennichi TaxID=94029 RepID=A0A8T0E774_ARGBR|nr:hypothetical protein HNY73_023251 [Argiope bruennichi]